MSGYKRVNFYELCRLCATNQQKVKTHIFEEEGRKIQLQNKIQSCLSLKVCETDFLPKVVCSQCLSILEECYTFRKECQGSETMLSSYFNNFRYTEDFKKSGKVYIKDISPKPSPIASTAVVTTPLSVSVTPGSQSDPVYGNSNYVSVVESPSSDISYIQVPNNTTSSTHPKNNMKSEIHSKVIQQTTTSQPQVAYNLNAVNIEVLKNILQNASKNEMVANVTVNGNGEIIGIGPIVNFDTLLSQSNSLLSQTNTPKIPKNIEQSNKPVVQKRKRQRSSDIHQTKRQDNSYLGDSLIKIDLSENESHQLGTCPESKSSTQSNKITYAFKGNESYKNSPNTVISVPDLNPTQLVQKFMNSSHLPQVAKLTAENEPNQVFTNNSNVSYASHINTSSINVMSNVNLQNVNLNTINIPSSLNSNNSINYTSNLTNLNTNTNYNHTINHQNSTNNLIQNIANPSINLQQNGHTKIQNIPQRKNYSMSSITPNNNNNTIVNSNIPSLDLHTHLDSSTLDKSGFTPTMNILNMNLTTANANLLNNLNLATNMNGLTSIPNSNMKSEQHIHTSTNNSVLNMNTTVKNPNLNINQSKVGTIASTNNLHMGHHQTVNTPPENGNSSLELVTNGCTTSTMPSMNNQPNLNGAPPTSSANLANTAQTDTTVKSHTCEICKKAFKRKEHLCQHMKLHTGFRPFRCDDCNKCFMRKEHLLRHMMAHSGTKNFTCEICDKSFSRNDNLLKHKKTHEKQSKFVCQVCQKHFVMKHYYLAHKLTHETDRCSINQLWGVLKA